MKDYQATQHKDWKKEIGALFSKRETETLKKELSGRKPRKRKATKSLAGDNYLA